MAQNLKELIFHCRQKHSFWLETKVPPKQDKQELSAGSVRKFVSVPKIQHRRNNPCFFTCPIPAATCQTNRSDKKRARSVRQRTHLCGEALDKDGDEQVEEHVVAERHERDEVERGPR